MNDDVHEFGNHKSFAVVSPEQREAEQEEDSECREEGQDLPIACGEDIHLYDNQISPGPGQCCRGEATAPKNRVLSKW